MIRILIADDHAVVRQGIKQILSEEPDMRFLGEAKEAQDVLDKMRRHNWDILILDINMPGRGGLDILKEVKEIKPKLPVLILSMYPEEQFAVRALKEGASGYITKESTSEELVKAIRKILRGGKYVSAQLAEKLVFDLQTSSGRPPHELLSNREFQILRLLATGKTVTEVSRRLNLSVKTISTYRTRILHKMNLRTSAALIHYALKKGLVD